MKKLQINGSARATIVAGVFWNGTGVQLEKGMRYDIQVSPPDQIWTDGKLFVQKSTANGFSNPILNIFKSMKRSKTEKWFTLIGCIDKIESTFFRIGTSCVNYEPIETGELICFANDAENHYENNNGEMVILITRIS